MYRNFILFIGVLSYLLLCNSSANYNDKIENSDRINDYANTKQTQDTCIIAGMTFEIIGNDEINGLKAIIRSEKLKVEGNRIETKDYRVIRYVFSIWRGEEYFSIRNYGELVSFPIINILKTSQPGEQFYFEDILIADPSKVIHFDSVKSLIIRRI